MADVTKPKKDHLYVLYLFFGTLASIAVIAGFWYDHPKSRDDSSQLKNSNTTQPIPPTTNHNDTQPQIIEDTRTPFERMRDELVDVLRKGPDFSGTVVDPDGNESPVEFSVMWDDGNQKATGEFHFLTNNNRVRADGSIRFTEDHRHVTLNLVNGSYDQNSFYTLGIVTPGKPELAGIYHSGSP